MSQNNDPEDAFKIPGYTGEYEGHRGFIDKRTVDLTMGCLDEFVREAESDRRLTKGFLSQANILLELLYHSMDPEHSKIDPRVFANGNGNILDRRLFNNGPFIGDWLFGSKWKATLADGKPLEIPDEKIRAVIIAANPSVSISFDPPYEVGHEESSKLMEVIRDKRDRIEHQQQLQRESGDSTTKPIRRIGAGWVDRCAVNGTGVADSSTHIG